MEIAKTTKKNKLGTYCQVSTDNIVDINLAVLNTDLAIVENNIKQYSILLNQIEEKRRRYKYFVELFSSPEKQEELLKQIESSANKIKQDLATIPPQPQTIMALVTDNEKGTKRQLAKLLIWLNGQYNVHQPLTNEQILSLTDIIVSEFGGLYIEHIVDCFKSIILRPKNTVQFALDPPTVLSWLSSYKESLLLNHELKNYNLHLQIK